MPLPDACLVAMTTAVVEGERAAAAKLQGALSSFLSQVFFCVSAIELGREFRRERENEVTWKKSKANFLAFGGFFRGVAG